MRSTILRLAADLEQRGEAFVLATVVRREAPSSAHLGDGALITASGAFRGWLGGSCTQPTVVRQALLALAERKPRLIALRSDPDADDRPGVTALPMTCHSGGSVDIYIEPVVPASRLVVFGISPTAQAVARIAHVLGYAVEAVDPDADRAMFPEADHVLTDITTSALQHRSKKDPNQLSVVVATLGEHDVEAIRAALDLEPAYLAVVASRKRFAQLREALVSGGTSAAQVEQIRNPAGLDIGAVTPEEIALSILAELVQFDRSQHERRAESDSASILGDEARDPVCGMSVATDSARYRAEIGDQTFYFCGASCRKRFIENPERFGVSIDAGDSA